VLPLLVMQLPWVAAAAARTCCCTVADCSEQTEKLQNPSSHTRILQAITNRQNSISSISSYNFTIPATTKEITQTCRTLPILIIFLVYIPQLRLSVSLSFTSGFLSCLFSSIGSRQNVAQLYYTYQLRFLPLDLSTTPPSVSHLQQSRPPRIKHIRLYIHDHRFKTISSDHQFSKQKAAAAHDSSIKLRSSLDWWPRTWEEDSGEAECARKPHTPIVNQCTNYAACAAIGDSKSAVLLQQQLV
jgi:hypothetical protein